MELQEIFDKINSHMIAQGKIAYDDYKDQCCYRDPDGYSCAVGCLIADEDYDPAFESIVIGTVKSYQLAGGFDPNGSSLELGAKRLHDALVKTIGELTVAKHLLLRDLQELHDRIEDENFAASWKKEAAEIGQVHGLVYND